MAPDVRRDEIEGALRQARPDGGDLTGFQPLLKGHGHQSFVLETSARTTLLLKIALRREQLGKMRSLRQVLQLTAQHRIPAPKLLYFSEGSAFFGGRPWLIQEFLAGEDGEAAIGGMSEPQRAAFFRDFGEAVARLHAVDLGYFSEDLASPGRADTWAAVVEARLDRLTREHRRVGLLAREHVEAAAETIRSIVREVSPAVRPALVHRDLYLPNTLVTTGRFQCLLDFEHARSSDALSDFVKLTMWVFDEVPGSQALFCAGYGSNPVATGEGRRRYEVALGLELLSGLLYWNTTEQSAMLADYRTRVGRWLGQR